MTLPDPSYHPKTAPPNTFMREDRASTYELGKEHKHLVHSSPQYLFEAEMREKPQVVLTANKKRKCKEMQVSEH